MLGLFRRHAWQITLKWSVGKCIDNGGSVGGIDSPGSGAGAGGTGSGTGSSGTSSFMGTSGPSSGAGLADQGQEVAGGR
jgi:hypothetical protein